MHGLRIVRIAILAVVILLGGLGISSSGPAWKSDGSVQSVSYNPGDAAKFHSPLSSMALVAVNQGTPVIHGKVAQSPTPQAGSSMSSIPVDALRFITDGSYMPQSETSVSVDPADTNHVVGGMNDGRFFFCGGLPPSDCPSGYTESVTGYTVSADGGRLVFRSDDMPGLNETVRTWNNLPVTEPMASWGDPSVAAGVHGEFFFASLLISFYFVNGTTQSSANGIELSVSNASLFNPAVACATPITDFAHNACWNHTMIAGNLTDKAGTFEDKDLVSVDRDPTSPYYGDVYVSWDHFTPTGTSQGWVARCTPTPLACTMLAGGFAPSPPPPLTGGDSFVAFTSPSVGSDGAAHFTWCDYGTATTLYPIYCRVRSTAPNGGAFGGSSTVLSFDGTGTTLPNDLGLGGYATEQFRTASIPGIAVDTSPGSNNLYFTIEVCTAGNYYNFPGTGVHGNCGSSSVLFSRSTDGGATWSAPGTLSVSGLNIQPWVTTDPVNGNVVVAYYTTRFDPFDHRTDVVASVSADQGLTFSEVRVTNVSDEPNADPVMYDYLVRGGFGGSFVVPQYGDYLQVAAIGGEMWVLFTGNYASELGTFQADPWLALSAERGPLTVAASAAPNPTDAGVTIGFTASAANASGATSFAWAFGDGSTASGSATPTHAYAALGTYTATVWANDGLGRSARSEVIVTVVTGLTALQTATPSSTDVGLNVSFAATPAGGQGTYTYAWMFGDGATSTVRNPIHAYAGVGTYTVVLWVNDSGGASVRDQTTVYVNPQPTATASASVSATDVGQPAAFTNVVTGGTVPYTFLWDFLDSSESATGNPSHAYATPGTYHVKFTVTDAAGASSSVVVTLTVNPAPVASATAATYAPGAGDAVGFTGSATGGTTPLTYAWSFGDGSTSGAQNPSHAFANAGTYTVKFWVNDSAGASSMTTLTVAVSPGAVATSTALIGIGLAFLIGVIATAAVMILLARRRKKQEPGPSPPEGANPPPPPPP